MFGGMDRRRLVPRTDAVLADPRLVEAGGRLGGAPGVTLPSAAVSLLDLRTVPPERDADVVGAVLAAAGVRG